MVDDDADRVPVEDGPPAGDEPSADEWLPGDEWPAVDDADGELPMDDRTAFLNFWKLRHGTFEQARAAWDAQKARSSPPPRRSRLLTCEMLDNLPDPEWLVTGVIPRDVFAELWGPWGAGKSFLALSLALSIALGIPWFGCSVVEGPVIYIAAEGVRGLNKRRRAWAQYHNNGHSNIPNFRAVAGPVQLLDDGDVDRFIDDDVLATVREKVALVVVDTMARSTVGGDENGQQDMGLMVASCDRIRTSLGGTTVLGIHQSNAQDKNRGSRVPQDAADAIWAMTNAAGLVTLKNDKMKDWELQPTRMFRLQPVEDPSADDDTPGEKDTRSCVLVPEESASPAAVVPKAKRIAESRRLALRSLITKGRPVSHKDWQNVTIARPRTFDNAIKALAALGYVERMDNGLWTVTPDGRIRAQVPEWIV